jgi:hypothetical protein
MKVARVGTLQLATPQFEFCDRIAEINPKKDENLSLSNENRWL